MHRTVLGNVRNRKNSAILAKVMCILEGSYGMADTNPAVVCDREHINMGY